MESQRVYELNPPQSAGLAREKEQIVSPLATITMFHYAHDRLQDGAENFRLLVDSVLDYAIFILDPGGHVVTWNAGAQRLKGYREDEILGQHFSRFYPHEDTARGKPQRGLELASAHGRFEDEGWRVRKDGSTFWASAVIAAIRDKAGELLGFAKVTRDLTERKLATDQLKSSEARLQVFMNHSASLMFIKDLQGRYLYVNDAFTRAFDLEREDIVSRTDWDIFPAEFAEKFRADDSRALAARSGVELEEVAPYCDGALHTNIVHKFPLLDANGRVTALGGVATDITDRKLLEAKLRERNARLSAAIDTEIALRERQLRLELIATHDALTGVLNRAALYRRAEHAIVVSRRSGRLFALLFIDLDRFKDVNDSLGHPTGDQVLREVATRLSGCLREVDAIARHGGDEFVALLEDIDRPVEVEQVTLRMQQSLAAPFVISAQKIQVTCSIGVAFYPRDGDTVSKLVSRSDVAMYRAKQLGRNVQFYASDLDL